MKDNTFSITIPTHNKRGKLLARAIKSIVNQTYPHWELIVVDDHSIDDTKEIVLGFKDPRIRYIRLEHGSNRYFARNAGMKRAENEWICWGDSDDSYLEIYLEVFNDWINQFPEYKVFNCATLVQHNRKEGEMAHYKYSTVRNVFEPKELEVGHEHFESGKIGSGQFVFHKSVLEKVGYLAEATTFWDFAKLSGIPGYGYQKPCGNPFGGDFAMFYKITRKFKTKPIPVCLYQQHTR